jgi:serine/threonine protein kinase
MTNKDEVPSEEAIQIFEQVIDLDSPSERERLLQELCGDRTDLRATVEELLENHRNNDPFQDFTPKHPVHHFIGEQVGDNVGRYKLVRVIGEGGWGVVYRAEQDGPLHLQVALKVVKPGMDTRQVLRRFESERQALARLEHSSIARVFDAGATSAGRPYFVMEWVHGKTITDYADSHNLTISQRLDLFVKVCRAVQHAHEKGIIHRDIKPSNILVAEENGEPLPKVIDFGIAKATGEDDSTETTFATRTGQFVGTPAYMSPEQADGIKIDNRTDIYSLGVLLCELLVGDIPFAFDGHGKYEQLRIIIQIKPQKPSVKLQDLEESEIIGIAQLRQTKPKQLLKTLEDGLDRIVMKCLEKTPDRRYETAESLANDIQLCQKHLTDNRLDPTALGTESAQREQSAKQKIICKLLG